jgi:hypothetical protein
MDSRATSLRRWVAAFGAGLILAFASSSSGSSAGPTVAPDNVVKGSDFSRYKPASVGRAFLQYWSSLQFQSWPDVVAFYDPRLRDFIGTGSLIGAKKLDATLFPQLKPGIVRVSSKAGNDTLHFTLRLSDGTKEFDSTTWRRAGGNWQIIYDSRLDDELRTLFQQRVEQQKNPAATASTPPSQAALRAGNNAAQLQTQFLRQQFKRHPP